MKEFKVNNYITLKYEEGKTNVYVNGVFFNQCVKLIIRIPKHELTRLNEIDSVDEAEETVTPYLQKQSNEIPPDVEFWGHCSNLQVWVEHDYDTRLLHRTLAFPLLKKLTELGDSRARIRFKEEIIYRYSRGNSSVIYYLQNEGYLNYLGREELKFLFKESLLNENWYAMSYFFDIEDGFINQLWLKDLKIILEEVSHILKMKLKKSTRKFCKEWIQRLVVKGIEEQFSERMGTSNYSWKESDWHKREKGYIESISISRGSLNNIWRFSDIFGFELLTDLREIELRDFENQDIGFFNNFKKLEELSIRRSKIRDINGLTDLKKFKAIRFEL